MKAVADATPLALVSAVVVLVEFANVQSSLAEAVKTTEVPEQPGRGCCCIFDRGAQWRGKWRPDSSALSAPRRDDDLGGGTGGVGTGKVAEVKPLEDATME